MLLSDDALSFLRTRVTASTRSLASLQTGGPLLRCSRVLLSQVRITSFYIFKFVRMDVLMNNAFVGNTGDVGNEIDFSLLLASNASIAQKCCTAGFEETLGSELVSGLTLLTFMNSHLFQFHFADTEHSWHPSWLITLTFFRTDNKHVLLVLDCGVLKNPVWRSSFV